MDDLHISRAALDAIIAHARTEVPRECCGLLVGEEGVVGRAVATRNESESPFTRYRVDPADHFRVIRDLRGTAAAIVGAYHSHPFTAALPSPTDLAEAWPAPFVYLIVSLRYTSRPDIRAYCVKSGEFVPVTLVLDGERTD